ncbi:MAG: 2-C-methyl-D-erythritol 2,4-cyclodiphosphate synthase [Actinobacteria bacterium]|nr:2-C-methyl-D-erythritol 2,4-cyclodiphosphate synthase [Actinomycetota bacterium]
MHRVRVGQGFDVHRFGGEPPMMLGGIVVTSDRGVIGTSDADVALHALMDALLGAAAMGDIGEMFPSGDPAWAGAASLEMLGLVTDRIRGAGYRIGNVDLTIVCEKVRVAPHRHAMRVAISEALSTDVAAVSVKATTTDGLGHLGLDEGIAAHAIVLLYSDA